MSEEKIIELRNYFMGNPKGAPERIFGRFAEHPGTFLCFHHEGKYLLAAPLADADENSLDYIVLYKTREDKIRWFKSMDTVANYLYSICNVNPLQIKFIR